MVVGVPIGTDMYVLERAMGVVKNGGENASITASLSYRTRVWQQAAALAIVSLGQITRCTERALDTRLPLEASNRADNGAQQAYGKTIEPPGAAEA